MKERLHSSTIGRVLLLGPRAWIAAREILRPVRKVLPWLIESREYTNWSYNTTKVNQLILCAFVHEISRCQMPQIFSYLDEITQDIDVVKFVRERALLSDRRSSQDETFRPGRRLAQYLLVRALRPRLVVEAGVDKGLGAMIICRALARNRAEGAPGDFLGFELNRSQACDLYVSCPWKTGLLRWGDSTELLLQSDTQIDLFFHETTPEPTHVSSQIAALERRMASPSVLLSPWVVEPLARYSVSRGLRLLTHQDEPIDHWYRGSTSMAVFGDWRSLRPASHDQRAEDVDSTT